jgi:hypothetical protein
MGRRKVTEEIVVDSIVEEKIEELKIEELAVEEEPDPLVESLIDNGQLFGVFDNGNLVAAVYQSSPTLDELLEYNKKQLETRLNFLHEIVTDEAEVCKMNINGTTKYSSWRQYRIQNGLSLSEPPITKRIQYYQKQYQNLTEEEIAIRVYGNLRYSFTPIDML